MGVRHIVEVEAESLYEAGALAIPGPSDCTTVSRDRAAS
jgi:hypothetical protein